MSGMARLHQQIARKGANQARIAENVISEPTLLPELIEGLNSPIARLKYGSGKVIRLLAEKRPELLYPHFDLFVKMLDHENNIFQWEGIIVLSMLAQVDKGGKWDAIFEKFFAPISGPVMITAANVIVGAGRVALARPDWADRIAGEILKVSRANYATTECRNVAIGHAIESLGKFYHLLQKPGEVESFVRKQLKNPRQAARRKAEAFLRRLDRAKAKAVKV